MKKFIYFIIFLIAILFENVYAEMTLNLQEPIVEFPSIENYSLQGFTTTDKYLFMILNGFDDEKSMIKVYDLNTFKQLISYDYDSLGHANDVTYNSNNKMIYVLAGGGSKLLFEFDSNDFKYVRTIELELPGRSITYIEDIDSYAIRTVSTGFRLNKKFELYNKMPFIVGMNIRNDLGRQGWAYYNNNIYYSNWSWIRLGGDGSNVIFVYNMDGENIETYYTGKNIGEIEDVAFFNNKMILGFNGYDDKIKFYMIDVPEIANINEEFVSINNSDEIDNVKNTKFNYMYIILPLLIIILIIFILKVIKNTLGKN